MSYASSGRFPDRRRTSTAAAFTPRYSSPPTSRSPPRVRRSSTRSGWTRANTDPISRRCSGTKCFRSCGVGVIQKRAFQQASDPPPQGGAPTPKLTETKSPSSTVGPPTFAMNAQSPTTPARTDTPKPRDTVATVVRVKRDEGGTDGDRVRHREIGNLWLGARKASSRQGSEGNLNGERSEEQRAGRESQSGDLVCLHLPSMAGAGARDNTGAINTDAAMVGLEIRPYRSADAAGTLAVFLAAITQTASADYSREQIAAWARPGSRTVP